MDEQARVRGRPIWWASRTFSTNGWYPIQDQFEEDYEASGEPIDMMLCRTERPGWTTLYVGMPETNLLDAYSGFVRCPRPGPPFRPLLLMGDTEAFNHLFHRRRETRDRVD